MARRIFSCMAHELATCEKCRVEWHYEKMYWTDGQFYLCEECHREYLEEKEEEKEMSEDEE